MATTPDPQFSEESTAGLPLLEQRDWLRFTLSSIGDAIVTTDALGSVTFLNRAAEDLTGWPNAEAVGLPLETVVRIIKEVGREPIENPATRALREGTTAGLVDDCLLLARNGTELPIDDSSATIRNELGEITGVVLIFRDSTEPRRRVREVRQAFEYDEEILATLSEPFLVLDENLRVRTANSAFYAQFLVTPQETIGRLLRELGNGQWDIVSLRTLLQNAVLGASAVEDFQVDHDFETIGPRTVLLNARGFRRVPDQPPLVLFSIKDITDRERSNAVLRESELRFRRLFLTAKDGILILDAKLGTIIEANPFICGLLGYELEEFLGKELWQIGLFRDKKANQAAYQKLRTEGYIRYEHLPLRTKQGDEVEVEFVSNLYRVGSRHVAQCNIRDITLRCRMERRDKDQAAALADLHRRKDEFLAMLSHELRNPLSPILNAVQLLRVEGNENAIQREARDIIERQVGQLSHIIDDLLEVSRFTSGKIRLHPIRLEMKGVVVRGIESARPFITRRRHVLTLDLPEKPIWLNADPARLEQVVVNLLNNAAKYTDEGGQIWLSLRTDGSDMVLSVRDSGIGIDLKEFPDIFDLFTQASRSLDRSQGGLGIGLSLVQRLVEMHQGTVEVKSDGLGRGSEFRVRLPLMMASEPVLSPPEIVGAAEPTKQGWRLLVVDDNVDSAEVLAKLLRRTGHDVQTAYTGPDALIAAAEYVPDLILLDIGLPGLNGYEVARRIRENPGLKQVKLVAMTGYGQDSDRQLASEVGFDEHLVKPVNFAKILELLTAMLAPPDIKV